MLSATPGSLQDSLVWFSDRRAGNVIGYGRKLLSPYLISGSTYKFYVGSYNGLNVIRVPMGGGTNGQNGAMFDIRATAGDLKIDSIHFECRTAPGSPVAADLYIRQGSYLDPGAASTATMWTKVWSGNVISRGTGISRTNIPHQFTLKSGVQYAIYVNTPGDVLGYANGAQNITNAELTISGGYGIAATFGGTFNPRTFNGAVHYTKPICPSALDSAEIKVNPAPWGASVVPGAPHVTSPKRSGNGGLGSPRVVAFGDTLAWNLLAPNGYNNADHGTTWKITNTSLSTKSGRVLTGYTWSDPSATAAGRFVYTPASTEIDSQLVGKITFQDIGKNNCDSAVVFYMYVAPLPEPDFTRSKVTCEGDAVEFVNKSKIASGFLDHMWYFGDGDSSEAFEPVHFYPKGGVYYVKYKAISSIYGYERIKRDTITVSPLPNVNFRILNVCEGKTHQFINTSTGLGTLTYKWNFGVTPGTNATSKDATFKYSKPGQYNVTLTVEDNGCPAARTKTAYLFHTPVSDFSYPSATGQKFCSNVPVQFTNKSTLVSGILGQSWSFGDGEVGTVKNPLHQFKNGGSFNVRLISISEFGCADTTIKKIDIGSAPVVTWTNGQVCDQTPTQFTNGTAPISGFASAPKWSFGDGSTSTSDNPAHQFTTLGPKTVKLVVSVNNGCSDSLTKTLNVGTQAIADFSVQNTCSGKPVQFDNKSSVRQGNMVYEWDFGDGSPVSNVSDPVHTYNTSNSFSPNVKLKVVVDGACETVVTKPLQVFELPNCTFTVTDDWTPGDGYRTIKVQAANTTYPFYRYKFSDGGSLNTSSGVYQFPYEGDFDITLYTRNQADCECSKTIVKSVRNSMGTTGLGDGNIKLYPNPSNGLVNVESGSRIQKIAVYNVLGESVEAGVELKGNKAELRMQGLSEGVYLVKITTEQGVITRSVSINR
jgi:PKD repeat protein